MQIIVIIPRKIHYIDTIIRFHIVFHLQKRKQIQAKVFHDYPSVLFIRNSGIRFIIESFVCNIIHLSVLFLNRDFQCHFHRFIIRHIAPFNAKMFFEIIYSEVFKILFFDGKQIAISIRLATQFVSSIIKTSFIQRISVADNDIL